MVFTTPLLSEAKSHRNTSQFTKKKPRFQRGGVRRGKPESDNGANESVSQTMLQGRGRGLA